MSTQQASTKQISVTIGGMGCTGCANTIQNAIQDLDGVTEATVDLESDTATVTHDPEVVSSDHFKEAVEKAGYDFTAIR